MNLEDMKSLFNLACSESIFIVFAGRVGVVRLAVSSSAVMVVIFDIFVFSVLRPHSATSRTVRGSASIRMLNPVSNRNPQNKEPICIR